MEQLLKPVEKPDSVFIYRDDQKFTCSDYDKLSQLLTESLFKNNRNERFMTDLRYSSSHPLMFEFSVVNDARKNTFDFWNRFVDFIFIKALQKYINLPEIQILQAMSKSQTKGLRIYVTGVEISHDDYLHLCNLLERECRYRERDLDAVLEIRSDFPLPSSDRLDGDDLYVPVRLMDVKFNFYHENNIWYPYRQEIIEFDETDHESLVRDMMPVSQKDATHVHFPMDIFHEAYLNNVHLRNEEYVGSFKSYINMERYVILRFNLLEKGKGFCYNFLKRYANTIELTRKDGILHFWYKLLKKRSPLNDPFMQLDQILRRQCPHLSEEASPLRAVLAKYERPVYYALYNLLRNEVDFFNEMRKQFPFLSKDLPSVPPEEAKDLDFNTILYCAYMTGEGTIFDNFGVAYDYIAKNIHSIPLLEKHVCKMQEKIFPIAVSDSGKKHIWDPNTNEWKKTSDDYKPIEIENLVRDIVRIINSYGELSTEIIYGLLNNKYLMDRLFSRIGFGDNGGQRISSNKITENIKMYGHNVPRYYFFDENFTQKMYNDKPLEDVVQPFVDFNKLTDPSPNEETISKNEETDPSPNEETISKNEETNPSPNEETDPSPNEYANEDKLTVAPKEENIDKNKLNVESPAKEEENIDKKKLNVESPDKEEETLHFHFRVIEEDTPLRRFRHRGNRM